ncbi:MAG TPA: metal/formaldehyde-sensitive transcriptional repressor [Steroidobacteraceae bacterium]|nr:metal/formaldehyde-sensitive transcriptional repressor [Steroidobacteraceae bacterium]
MAHVTQHRKKLLARVRRIGGQVSGLEKSLQADIDCAAVLTQIAAVRGAVQGLMMEVLEDHLREHVVGEADRARRQRELSAVTSLMRTFVK